MSDNPKVKFGLINALGFMNITGADSNGTSLDGDYADRYVFCHPTYTITTSFDRNHNERYGVIENDSRYYTRKYRKNVLWDFGDGTTVEAKNATHSYKKPGKYKVTCTFFDINRLGYRNEYFVWVVVKEVLPTEIRMKMLDRFQKVKCSKVEKIQELEVTLNNRCPYYLDVKADRVWFSKEDEANEISYFERPNKAYSSYERSWCFLENHRTNQYRTQTLENDLLVPVKKYIPSYDNLYGKFVAYKDNGEPKLRFDFQFVNIMAEVDQKLLKIQYTNPQYHFLDAIPPEPELIEGTVEQIYSSDRLDTKQNPYVGARAFVDVYYKSDYLRKNMGVVYSFDLERALSEPDLMSSTNYINQPTPGQQLAIVPNDPSEVKWCASIDGFIHTDQDNRKDVTPQRKETIDIYAEYGLVKGKTQNLFFIPYVSYGKVTSMSFTPQGLIANEEYEFLQKKMNYYIPKDILYNDYLLVTNASEGAVKQRYVDGFDAILSHVKCYTITPDSDRLHINFMVNDGDGLVDKIDQTIAVQVSENVVVPKIKGHDEDFETLMDSYMPHRMFKDKDNLRDAMRAVFKNSGALDYMMSYSKNFFDNVANYKTCFLSKLLSILRSMDEQVVDYEASNFEGVNELRDFVRLLSINHSELVGHRVYVDYDYHIFGTELGVNVGDLLSVDDEISVNRNGEMTHVNGKPLSVFSPKIIVHDKYTQENWLVDFTMHSGGVFKIGEYKYTWKWRLLLPERFDRPEMTYPEKAQIVDSYYEFYILDPRLESERLGNLIDEKYISDEIESVEKWNELWGITYECLLKIMSDNIADGKDGGNFDPHHFEPMPEDMSKDETEELEPKTMYDRAAEKLEMLHHDYDKSGEYHPFRRTRITDVITTEEGIDREEKE